VHRLPKPSKRGLTKNLRDGGAFRDPPINRKYLIHAVESPWLCSRAPAWALLYSRLGSRAMRKLRSGP